MRKRLSPASPSGNFDVACAPATKPSPQAHAATVIFNPYQAFAAIFQRDIYAFGTGINGVFNQLFHRAGRTLDNFTGGNAVDRAFV